MQNLTNLRVILATLNLLFLSHETLILVGIAVLIGITLDKITSLSRYGSYLVKAGITVKTKQELADTLLGYLQVSSKEY